MAEIEIRGELTRIQKAAARMLARGESEADILACIFKVGAEATPYQKNKALTQLRKWTKNQKFKEYYREVTNDIALAAVGSANMEIYKQLKSNNPWIVNKAANDIINKAFPLLFGEEEKNIVVKVEGMPALGTPDADEETADDDD